MPDEQITRWQKALRDFGYPYSLAAPDRIEALLGAERERGAQQGFAPVVIVPGLWNSTPMPADERAAKALRSITDAHDAAFGRDFLARRFNEWCDESNDDPELSVRAEFEGLAPVAAPPPQSGLSLLKRYDPEARSLIDFAEVAIMRIPTLHDHTIPVYLGWGGWNAAPPPLEITAVARHWGETHGARLVAIGPDKLEFSVARKPADHGEAVALLKEHYAFAPDNWELDHSVLEQAAAELQVAHSWAFWWD